ncbi:MAG TPA: hypothetical protein VF855_01865 [Acidimicrobiales bacterium]
MKWIYRAVGLVVVAAAAALALLVVGLRTKSKPVLSVVRRVNRGFTNPRVMKTAGTPGASTAVIRHIGRTSGRVYQTPVGPFPVEDGFVIALPYGAGADWARNVLASGTATLVHDGEEIAVDGPEVVPTGSVVDHLPPSDQRTLRWFGVTECLQVRRAATQG